MSSGIGLVIVCVLVFGYYFLIPRGNAYMCPNCKETFKKESQHFISIHTFGGVLLKCPHCGKTAMMRRTRE